MLRIIRLTLAALIAVAFVLGAMGSIASANSSMALATSPCGMEQSMPHANDTKPMAPCKGIKSDCVNQMDCISLTALPAPVVSFRSIVQYGLIDYRISFSKLDSLDLTPEPLPPRTI
jgi:hypothetical protein